MHKYWIMFIRNKERYQILEGKKRITFLVTIAFILFSLLFLFSNIDFSKQKMKAMALHMLFTHFRSRYMSEAIEEFQ